VLQRSEDILAAVGNGCYIVWGEGYRIDEAQRTCPHVFHSPYHPANVDDKPWLVQDNHNAI
jgi:hypothetical protein